VSVMMNTLFLKYISCCCSTSSLGNMPPATTHLKIFRPWANKNCFMSVKKNWCPKLNTINHVHSRLPEYIWSPMKGVWNSSHSKFCRSTSCYLIKHNLVMAPKASLTYLPTTQAWRPLASFRPVSRYFPIPVRPGSFFPHWLIVL
jgi:hypothetical protein